MEGAQRAHKINMNHVFVFMHNPCTYESEAVTISVHKTLIGAWKACHKEHYTAWLDARKNALTYGNSRDGNGVPENEDFLVRRFDLLN